MAITWKPYDEKRWGEDRAVRYANFGGLGGFFERGMRWDGFLSHFDASAHTRLEELRADILANRVRTAGAWHQDTSVAGVPHWDDGALYLASYRCWGDLMAAVWSTEEDKDYWYGDFAWGVEV
jgi:hypothetical protein